MPGLHNDNSLKTLLHSSNDGTADRECEGGNACQHAATFSTTPSPDGRLIAAVWEHLSPTIRDAILTLIEADLARATQ